MSRGSYTHSRKYERKPSDADDRTKERRQKEQEKRNRLAAEIEREFGKPKHNFGGVQRWANPSIFGVSQK